MDDTNSNAAHKPFINIENINARGSRITIEINVSDDIKKYFNTLDLYIDYEQSIEKNDRGILAIPALSSIIPVAWATGSDVYVDTIDRAFFDSLSGVEEVYKRWFPLFKFGSTINVKNKSINRFNNRGYALLFSGGLDSLTSYINNKEKRPMLFTVWGADIPTREIDFWNRVKKQLSQFATNEKVGYTSIKTNLRESINEVLLEESGAEWWLMASHGLTLAGLTAPLLTDGIGTLLIASSHITRYDKPNGSHLFLKTPVHYGDISIIYDLHELNRQEKIKRILKPKQEYSSRLRVCYSQFDSYNCSICEKCLRTMVSLVLEEIDPAGCNFTINDKTFTLIKNLIINDLLVCDGDTCHLWEQIRDSIPDNLNDPMYDSKDFFTWLKGFDLSKCDYDTNKRYRVLLRDFYIMKYIAISRLGKITAKSTEINQEIKVK